MGSQLSICALACRDTLGLGTPERVTLYFTESATRMSTTRTDRDLDAARADIVARTARIRSGDCAATPVSRCMALVRLRSGMSKPTMRMRRCPLP